MTSRTYLSIGDVLTLLREEFPDVTISKIRFLESQGLVNPERSPSGYRKFFEHDVERLRWVLRQQREHFLPLKVIRDRLADGDLGDDVGAEQPNGKTAQPAHAAAVAGARVGPRPGAADQGGRRGDGPHSRRRVAPRRPAARGEAGPSRAAGGRRGRRRRRACRARSPRRHGTSRATGRAAPYRRRTTRRRHGDVGRSPAGASPPQPPPPPDEPRQRNGVAATAARPP